MVKGLSQSYPLLFYPRERRFPARRRSLRCGLLLPCLTAACFLSVSSEAVDLSGRLTSSFYGSERSDNAYWRNYTRFSSTATLWRESQTRSLGLHTNLRWTGDLASNEPGTPQTYIYNMYFKLRGYPAGSKIYAGRLFAYNTLGSSLIDGARAKLRIVKCPLDRGPRYFGQSKMNFVGLALHGFKALMVFAEDVLVRVGLACTLIATLSVIGAGLAVFLKILGYSTPGWFSVAFGILMLLLLQTGALALMSLMLTGVMRGGAVNPVTSYRDYIQRVVEVRA